MATTVNKAVSKRFSAIFNQSPPDTPSLREQAFYVSSFLFNLSICDPSAEQDKLHKVQLRCYVLEDMTLGADIKEHDAGTLF